MKIILIDDDYHMVEVLKHTIDWRKFHIQDVRVAYHIAGAKKLFLDDVPEIIICDIEMPKGTGIELLTWIRGQNYQTEVIFFTCHENFQFASKAMEYGAISYVTKPFSVNKIEVAVEKAVQKVNQNQQYATFKRMHPYQEDRQKLLQETFWKDLLIHQAMNNEEALKRAITLRQLPYTKDAIFRLVYVSASHHELSSGQMDAELLRFTLKKLSAEMLTEALSFEQTLDAYDGNKYRVIVIIQNPQFELILSRTQQLMTMMAEQFHCPITCYMSEAVPLHDLAVTKTMLDEQDHNNLTKRHQLILASNVGKSLYENKDLLDLERLAGYLESYDVAGVSNTMKQYVEILTQKEVLNADRMHFMHQDFMQVIYTFLYQRHIQAHQLFSDPVSKTLNDRAEDTVFDLLKWVHTCTQKAIGFVKSMSQSMTFSEQAKGYIETHFAEPITKVQVADQVYLTPDYMGKIFKAETGMSIKDYIHTCRIQAAKTLLVNSSCSVSQVAMEVGFDSFSYFSTKFKKMVGVSPQVYKRQITS